MRQASKNRSPRARRPLKQMAALAQLRGQIVRGDYGRGDRLPTRLELEKRYALSPVTLQRVLDHLQATGFVEARGSQGTFVTAHPPHLTRYALVLPGRPSDSRLYAALLQVANDLERHQPLRFPVFCDVSCPIPSPTELTRLVAEIQGQTLAGLLFAQIPFPLLDTPVLNGHTIPMAAVMSAPMPQHPEVAAVYGSLPSFYERAVAHLAARGRRRIAVLAHGEALMLGPDGRAQFQALVTAHGLEHRPWWLQLPNYQSALSIHQAALILFSGLPPKQRPDALIIGDDNLVEHATAGIVAAGIAPADLDVVGLCNFPMPPPAQFPVTRLGFDLRALLQAALTGLDRQRQHHEAPPPALLPAVFEKELTP